MTCHAGRDAAAGGAEWLGPRTGGHSSGPSGQSKPRSERAGQRRVTWQLGVTQRSGGVVTPALADCPLRRERERESPCSVICPAHKAHGVPVVRRVAPIPPHPPCPPRHPSDTAFSIPRSTEPRYPNDTACGTSPT